MGNLLNKGIENGYEWECLKDGNVAITGYKGSETELVIPSTINGKTVTAIGKEAFYNCGNLTSVAIPNSIISIGNYAFFGCNNLTIYCEASSTPSGWYFTRNFCGCPIVWNYGGKYGVTHDGYKWMLLKDDTIAIAGYNGSDIDLTIPAAINGKKVTLIGGKAFYKNDRLESVTIQKGVTEIGESAFSSCKSLKRITIPSSVRLIGTFAFSCYDNLEGITNPFSGVRISSLNFACYDKLTIYCEAPSNPSVYYNWNPSFRPVVYNYGGEDGVTEDGYKWALLNDGSIGIIGYNGSATKLTISSTVSGRKVTAICSYAFNGCNNLTSVTMPESVTSIGDYAFSGCSLTSITIPEGITSIGNGAFGYCSKLESITIPSGLKSIGNRAFEKCSNLTIYYEASTKPSGWDEEWNSGRPVVWNFRG